MSPRLNRGVVGIGNGPPGHLPVVPGEIYTDRLTGWNYVATGSRWVLLDDKDVDVTFEDSPMEKRVCLNCGDVLEWHEDGLPVPQYAWRKSSYCPSDPLSHSHNKLAPLSTVKQQVSDIEKLWRAS